MKKRVLTLIMTACLLIGSSLTVSAAQNATVTFTENKTLEYSGVDSYEDGTPKLSTAFEGIAPGDTAEQTITMYNANERTVDFYMNADAIRALEDQTAQARGAGYDIKLTAGDTVLYDSRVGGYATDQASGSAEGILAMNEGALEGYVMVGTLAQGQSKDIKLSIYFDGEAMDNDAQGIDYSTTFGQLGFAFQVAYEDPEDPEVIYTEVTQRGQTNYVTRLVEIIEERVPLASVKTGDAAVIGLGIAILVFGVLLIVLTGRKKEEEEA